VDRQESSKEMLVKRDRLPAWVQNQLGRGKNPLASCSKTGCRLARKRNFADCILNNTPPAMGSNSSSKDNPVSLEIHFFRCRQEG
jgi:hypothetical protein